LARGWASAFPRHRRFFAFAGENRDRRPTFTPSVPFGDQDLGDRAFVDRLEFHRRLVGLDLGEDVAARHLVALLDQPFGKRALLHRRREGGHLELDRHRGPSREGASAQSQCGGQGQACDWPKRLRLRLPRFEAASAAMAGGGECAPIWS
jgi:hypothetical protein